MLRITQKFEINDVEKFKKQMFFWAKDFTELVYLDSNSHIQKYSDFDVLLATEALTVIQSDYHDAFFKLHEYQKTTKDWLFGYLTYDVKNAVEDLTSNHFDGLSFPDLYFFQPQKIILIKQNQVTFEYLNMCADEIISDFEAIQQMIYQDEKSIQPINIQAQISKERYLDKIQKIQEHIHRGDIYEMNFCMEFFAENQEINPFEVFQQLNDISKAPFATFFKNKNNYLLSASPERYLKKLDKKIISQPIKGTASRSENLLQDEQQKQELQNNFKERSENIMITDLVRNDLSRTAQKGTVKVEELCGVYTFKQVHQLISTITSELDDSFSPVLAIETTFPMGSMTGAPKIAAMKIIEQYEETKRGLYSGAIGYFTPQSDFDFSVVIRSILYNSKNKYVSFSVGSAITALSVPEQEYNECLLKAQAMKQVLGG